MESSAIDQERRVALTPGIILLHESEDIVFSVRNELIAAWLGGRKPENPSPTRDRWARTEGPAPLTISASLLRAQEGKGQ